MYYSGSACRGTDLPPGRILYIHTPPHWYLLNIFSYFKVCSDAKEREGEWGAESNGKLQHLFIPNKTSALVPEFAVEDLPLVELQTCPWAEHSDDVDDNDFMVIS